MDKLTIISGTLFLAADVFAIVSLAMPDWIITDVGGNAYQFSIFLMNINVILTKQIKIINSTLYVNITLKKSNAINVRIVFTWQCRYCFYIFR